MTTETQEEFQQKPLPKDVMGLINSGLEERVGHPITEFIIPFSLANVLNLVLIDYGITPAYEGQLSDEIREHIWRIIWECTDVLTISDDSDEETL